MDTGKMQVENRCHKCGQPGYIGRNFLQCKQVQVHQMLDDMLEFDQAVALEKYAKKDTGTETSPELKGQGVQAPQQ